MTTTVALLLADPTSTGTPGYRVGTVALNTYPETVSAILPVLVNTRAAAAALTRPERYETPLAALLAVGWQDVNFLFGEGAWFEVNDFLGSMGRQLAPAVMEISREDESPDGIDQNGPATSKQLNSLYRVTKSHVFDHDREALRAAGDKGTVAEVSALLDYVYREVKARKEAEKQPFALAA